MLNLKIKEIMPDRLLSIDWQLIALNTTSVGTIVGNAISDNINVWAVGFLIVTVGILNLAKAYSTIKQSKKKK